MKYWYEILAVTQRILLELMRMKRSLIFWTIFPISILLINSYILEETSQISLTEAMKISAPSSLVGAALFFSCLGGSMSTVVAEREQKTLKRLFISPLNGISYFIGIFFAHSLIGISQTGLVYLITFFFGVKISGSILLGITIIFLTIISYVGLGFFLGTQLAKRTEDINTLIATFGVPLLILGGAFLPISLFPENLKAIAKFNPIYHINQCLISVWGNDLGINDIKYNFIFLALFSLLMIINAWFSYAQMLKIEKQL